MNTEMTVPMTVEEVKAIVNSTNSFSREDLASYREDIRKFRAEKRERLASITPAMVAAVIEQRKLHIHSEKTRMLKSGQLCVTWQLRTEVDTLAKMKAKLAKLTEDIAQMSARAA